jgi:hypothetical protein
MGELTTLPAPPIDHRLEAMLELWPIEESELKKWAQLSFNPEASYQCQHSLPCRHTYRLAFLFFGYVS